MICSQSMKTLITKLYDQQTNGQTEKNAAISEIAKIIKSEVLLIPANKGSYPNSESLSDSAAQKNFVPDSLHRFLSTIFAEANCELKIASIGQAIIQAARPRSIIAPLQLGLGIQLHHTFKSKFLIETLYKLGFSSSYPEVQKFRFCAASTVDEIVPNTDQVRHIKLLQFKDYNSSNNE